MRKEVGANSCLKFFGRNDKTYCMTAVILLEFNMKGRISKPLWK